MSGESQDLIILANLASRAERWDDMKSYMKERVQAGGALSGEERDLLSQAFKEALNQRRYAVRVASSIELQEEEARRTTNSALAAGYKSKVEAELETICQEAVMLLSVSLLPKAESGEPKVFFQKMQGDYYRYWSEFTAGDKKREAAEFAAAAYESAMAEAKHHLLPSHPLKVGLALNYSVFLFECRQNGDAAVEIAEAAVLEASRTFEGMPEDALRDTQGTLQLLQENLHLWRSN
mmetsp:Transcript_53085/g.95189  ORF Transcript_53085/g.95189 Transcript_53085/m.95189 type:complete len:236 (+) Transcript_53085:88-795(+)